MTQSSELEAILQRSLDEHRFLAAVIATPEGLPLSTALKGQLSTTEILAAVAPVIQRAAHRSSAYFGLQEPDEAVIQAGRQKIVCRFFEVNQKPLILIAVVPKSDPYRRTMNRMVRDIRQLLSTD